MIKRSASLFFDGQLLHEFGNDFSNSEVIDRFRVLNGKSRFVLVVRGLPGSGKTYLSDSLAFGRGDVISIDVDKFRYKGYICDVEENSIISSSNFMTDFVSFMKETKTSLVVSGAFIDLNTIRSFFSSSAKNYVLDIDADKQSALLNAKNGIDANDFKWYTDRWKRYVDLIK
jgi:hypothetical protein